MCVCVYVCVYVCAYVCALCARVARLILTYNHSHPVRFGSHQVWFITREVFSETVMIKQPVAGTICKWPGLLVCMNVYVWRCFEIVTRCVC